METLIKNVNVATMVGDDYGILPNHDISVERGRIASITPTVDPIPTRKWLTPGLIDCHTHLVYAGNRADEFGARLAGDTYRQIAERGGGILSTVAATRATSEEELVILAQHRLNTLASEGVTTVEVKSGYGLDLATEAKMLRAASRLQGANIRRTLLAAHTFPPEFFVNREGYMDLICETMIPELASECDAVDAFCEGIAFNPAQVERVFVTAQRFGKEVKLHADQFSDLGGAGLAGKYSARSADHLEYTNEDSIKMMRQGDTVAVLLPGAFYFLLETQKPPIALFRKHGVPMAIATDHNPGSSPCFSILLCMNMACVLFGLSPLEALRGVTKHAAAALGMQAEIGTIEIGKRADFAVFEIDHPRDLASKFGGNPCVDRYLGGVRQLG